MTVLITGGAGFIGFSVAKRLIETRGMPLILVDSISNTGEYDPALKEKRIEHLKMLALTEYVNLRFMRLDVMELMQQENLMKLLGVTHILHLAAEAGVGRGEIDAIRYARSNVLGHVTMLEVARLLPKLKKIVYASSSSVYPDGGAAMSELHPTYPRGVYSATKASAELFSEAYARNYGLDQIGLRFFTVYGPWGRPDMAYWKFAEAMKAGKLIEIDDGTMRDFTYIDDIVPTIVKMLFRELPTPAHRIYNLGSNDPRTTTKMVELLAEALGVERMHTIVRSVPHGVAMKTWCDNSKAAGDYDFDPKTPLEVGIPKFVEWWKDFSNV